jgi:hypothetical protein
MAARQLMRRDYCGVSNSNNPKKKNERHFGTGDDDALTQLHRRVLTPRNAKLARRKKKTTI